MEEVTGGGHGRGARTFMAKNKSPWTMPIMMPIWRCSCERVALESDAIVYSTTCRRAAEGYHPAKHTLR